MKTSFYGLTFEQLKQNCSEASALFNWHYKKNHSEFCQFHNLSKSTRAFLAENLEFSRPSVVTTQEATDKTVKFLIELSDGERVETVLIPFLGKYTVCLSSQVGCAMACSFCYTGRQGFKRNLKTHEIIGQFLTAKSWLQCHRPQDQRVLNVVYMGQGEPLHNFDAVKDSINILTSDYGLSLATHKITVSTSGYEPGLKRWVAEMPNVNLALSLHSLCNEKRNQLIPLNQKYPIEQILALIEQIPLGKKRFITYEYLLAGGFNDSISEAHQLGTRLKDKKILMNLIPFNPFPGAQFRRPALEDVLGFKAVLEEYGLPTMVRTTKGDEILAACGQLNSRLQ